jgi:hypothetical protein
MAVSKLWPVTVRLAAVLDYAANPEKTTKAKSKYSNADYQALRDVVNYVKDGKKTEQELFCQGINCNPSTAREQFVTVKEQFDKPDGIQAYHGYLSFKETDITPELAQHIGMEFANSVWGKRHQVLVTTHLNTEHLHCHFVINSVSFVDGKRCRETSWFKFYKEADRICEKYGISTIKEPERYHDAKHLTMKDKAGMPTRYNLARSALDEAIEGTHEAIVSKEDFELAQKVIRGGGRNPTRKQHDYPLKGLVRCGNCKRAMTRRKNKAGIRYFQCIHSVNNGNTDCPIGRSFPEMDIEKVVFHAIAQFLALAQKEAVQNREVGDLRKSAIKECADKIRILQKQNEQHKASKLRLYEKYAAGSITKEAYIQHNAATDTKIAENDEAIQRSHERMKELDSETSCSDEKLDAVCDQYADCKALTYELTHAFISAVYIYDLDNIEIVWKFKDFLTTSEGEAK